MLWPRWLRVSACALFFTFLTGFIGWQTLAYIDASYPPPVKLLVQSSVEVTDRDGKLLRVYPIQDGRWRLEADLEKIDPDFIKLLLAYEDKRFFSHVGVDPLAMARAAGQFIVHGKIVSGGSTITMQLARLMESRASRSLGAKLHQIFRALQLERRFSKRELLQFYLKLAPYGGNLEGTRAASLAYFGKGPTKLSVKEAALLVALPQSPEARRPDRHPKAAKIARNRVVGRMAKAGLLSKGEIARISDFSVPKYRRSMPVLAAHLADSARRHKPETKIHKTTLKRAIQRRMERVAFEAAQRHGSKVSVAIMVAEASNGEILASVGSSDYFNEERDGFIDMSVAIRSPGSTLKPFIYGLAIEEGLLMPETMISDRPVDFSGYRPQNFDMTYQGDVSVRKALQMSLNVPAIRLLDKLGPARLVARMRRVGVSPQFLKGKEAGLAIGLGGVGLSLKNLVQLYVNLVSVDARPVSIGDGIRSVAKKMMGNRIMSRVAAWHVNDMLEEVAAPVGSRPLKIAYKTGTSYSHRDAWALGYDGRHVIGVWVGRADNVPVPGIYGVKTAAPILFEAFEKSGLDRVAFPEAPAGAIRIAGADLPPSMRIFKGRLEFAAAAGEEKLHILVPGNGAQVELTSFADGQSVPLVMKLQGGRPPFRLLANGRPTGKTFRRRQLQWTPDTPGFAQLTVIDAKGDAQSIDIFLRDPGA
ncbi:MAG: penicillin-binding protein 1C [Rhizobiaceae bacterium]|nr:penicillin-binding protein 1C [Rhizobiaceae bacterium]